MKIQHNFKAAHLHGLLHGLVYGGVLSAALFGALSWTESVLLILTVIGGPRLLWWLVTYISPIRTNRHDIWLAAVHEAGHAVVAWFHPDWPGVKEVKLTPRSLVTAGLMESLESSSQIPQRPYLIAQICVALGGRAAETIIMGCSSTGAQGDLEKVRTIAMRMVRDLAMHPNLAKRAFGRQADPQTEARLNEAADEIVTECWERSLALLRERRDLLEQLAQQLKLRHCLTGKELEAILDPRS